MEIEVTGQVQLKKLKGNEFGNQERNKMEDIG